MVRDDDHIIMHEHESGEDWILIKFIHKSHKLYTYFIREIVIINKVPTFS